MKTINAILALSTAVLLTACANPKTPDAGPMSAASADERVAAAPSAMHDRMQVMRDKMMSAKTPAERQALMDEHMKVMHQGMAMMSGMKGMGGMHEMPGMAGMKNMPMDPAKQQQMMEMRMDMMQTMMEMMMQRVPGAAMPPAGN
jgi:hypothetical protein